MGMVRANHVFHNGTTTIGDGEILVVSTNYTNLQVEMKTSGTATVKFEAMGELGEWRPLVGSKMESTISLVTETSDFEPFYQFDLTGYSKVKMKVTAIDGINEITVSGKIVG